MSIRTMSLTFVFADVSGTRADPRVPGLITHHLQVTGWPILVDSLSRRSGRAPRRAPRPAPSVSGLYALFFPEDYMYFRASRLRPLRADRSFSLYRRSRCSLCTPVPMGRLLLSGNRVPRLHMQGCSTDLVTLRAPRPQHTPSPNVRHAEISRQLNLEEWASREADPVSHPCPAPVL